MKRCQAFERPSGIVKTRFALCLLDRVISHDLIHGDPFCRIENLLADELRKAGITKKTLLKWRKTARVIKFAEEYLNGHRSKWLKTGR